MAASAKILLYKSKTYKNGKHPVLLRIVINRKVKYYNIGSNLKCLPAQWDEKENIFNKKFPNYQEANRNIRLKLGKADKILINLEDKNENFTLSDFDREFAKANIKIYLLEYIDTIIKRQKKAGKIGNSMAYSATKSALKGFFDGDVDMRDIDIKKLQLFIEHCQGKDLKPNTIGYYLRTLRAVYNKAIKEEGFEYYPFKGLDWKHLKNKTQKRAISKEDMIRIMNFEVEPESDLFHARQMFSFMYLTYGLNFADLSKLTENNIHKIDGIQILKYNRSKGGKLYEIPLNDEAFKILNYYLKYNTLSKKYIFPVLNENFHKTPTQIKTRIKTALKKLNSDLKIIGEHLEIPSKLTSYVSRHTFASVLVKAGTDLFTIGEMMGHSDLQTTKIYLQDLDYTEKIEASKKLTD
ncbi:MAG: site-specific integrase [Prolixibacteraceae bacterium]|nr:site-specific integrase [Prolixibacteraceae bacterium]